MTERLNQLMVAEADQLDIPPVAADAALARGRGMRRRRTFATAGATVAVLAVIGGTVLVATGGNGRRSGHRACWAFRGRRGRPRLRFPVEGLPRRHDRDRARHRALAALHVRGRAGPQQPQRRRLGRLRSRVADAGALRRLHGRSRHDPGGRRAGHRPRGAGLRAGRGPRRRLRRRGPRCHLRRDRQRGAASRPAAELLGRDAARARRRHARTPATRTRPRPWTSGRASTTSSRAWLVGFPMWWVVGPSPSRKGASR